MHNGIGHDVRLLEKQGFTVNGRLMDTMTLCHLAYPEFPKGLQFTSTLYTWAPVWKGLVDVDDEVEGKG